MTKTAAYHVIELKYVLPFFELGSDVDGEPSIISSVHFFWSARGAALFLWGRIGDDYVIYKNRELVRFGGVTHTNVEKLEKFLEGYVTRYDD